MHKGKGFVVKGTSHEGKATRKRAAKKGARKASRKRGGKK